MPATAKALPKETEQRSLCRERLEIMAKHRDAFSRIKEIDGRLKVLAGDEGGFRESFDGLGYVTVSPEKPETSDGIHPEVVEPVFYALPKEGARGLTQAKLIEAGIIKEALRMKRASYGRVMPNLF